MSDSEEDIAVEKYVPFSEREEWKDAIPIPQDDGPNPICSISYTTEFVDTMNYFRFVVHKNEMSDRALRLTNEVIKRNPANYTAWYFRRILLEKLNTDLRKELEFIDEIAQLNPKNYQIWYHRRACVEKLNDCSLELEFSAAQIKGDNKNYHAWAHRQWVVEKFSKWDHELEFANSLLQEDFRNNSAWNYRHFVIFHCLGDASSNDNSTSNFSRSRLPEETIEREVEYSFQFIKKAPNNQSPWTYIRGLFAKGGNYSSYPRLKSLCNEFKEKYATCPHVASLLVDIYQQEGTSETLQKAIELCFTLEASLDSIHKKYWYFVRNQLQQKLLEITK